MEINFTIGEKIKLLHDRSEGHIVQVYPNGRVLILVDDVLELEVSVDEIVKSKIPMPKSKQEHEKLVKTLSQSGEHLQSVVYFTIDIENNFKINYNIINHTPYTVIYAVANQTNLAKNESPLGIVYGTLTPASSQYLFSVKMDTWESHRHLLFNFIYFPDKKLPYLPPESRELRLRQKTFYNQLESNPYLGKPTILLPFPSIDDLKKIKFRETEYYDGWKSPVQKLKSDIIELDVPDATIDLHINSIVESVSGLSAQEMFDLQIETFERCLSLALAHGLSEITFIHGIGGGRLRDEIHERLKKATYVKEYGLSKFDRFGTGATIVYL